MTLRLGLGLGLTRGGKFLPNQLNGLALWLDGADTSTITQNGSGAVSAWADKSGNGNNATQSTGAAKPTTGSSTVNGRNVLSFDGGDYFDITALSQTAKTIFFVQKGTIQASDTSTFLGSSSPSGGDTSAYVPLMFNGSADAEIYRGITGATSRVDGVTVTPSNRDEIYDDFITGSAQITTINGTVNVATIDTIGSGAFGYAYLGDMAEILIYNRNLTSTETNQIGNYLAAKWGITWTNI